MARTAHTARKETASVGKKVIATRSERSLSVRTPVINQGNQAKKTTKAHSASNNILKEIKYYQTSLGFLIPKASIIRIIRGIVQNISKNVPEIGMRFTSAALNILHEAIENHVVHLLELSYMASRHAKRVTLYASDIRLIHRIKGINE